MTSLRRLPPETGGYGHRDYPRKDTKAISYPKMSPTEGRTEDQMKVSFIPQ